MLSDRALAKNTSIFRGGDSGGRPRIARTRRTDPPIWLLVWRGRPRHL